jgi:thiol:disulfide interchange protein DsbD
LVGILNYIFHSKDAVGGATALLSYSVGLGTPFWLVGALAVGLPKPGRWMNYVKSVFGVVLVVVGFHYARRAIPFLAQAPHWVPSVRWVAGTMAVVGLLVGAIHLQLKEGPWHERVRKVLGLTLASLGAAWFIGYEPSEATNSATNGSCAAITWERDPAAAQSLAQRESRPMVIDFGATWCPACEELAHVTFRAPEVACAARDGRFVTVKIYEDDNPPPNYDQLRSQFDVRALPTVVVLDSHGHEVARETQFVPATRMASLLHRADERHSER